MRIAVGGMQEQLIEQESHGLQNVHLPRWIEKAGLPVADIKVITAETDDNKLLGRSGQYTSKVYFTDTRHPKDPEAFNSVDNTIEGFASVDDAKKRAEYVGGIAKATPMFAQYIYQSGVFVVRLDKAVLPDEAKGYEAALKKITA